MKEKINEKIGKLNKKYIIVGVVIIILIILFVGFFTKGNIFDTSEEYKALEKVNNSIYDYLDLYGSSFTRVNKYYSFKACSNGKENCDKKNMKKVEVQMMGVHTAEDGSIVQEIKISNLITAGYLDDLFTNPSNNKRCFRTFGDKITYPVITVYVDEKNLKYYYYVDLSGNNTACHFKEKNSFITNFPDNLVKALKKAKVDLPKQFDNK